MRLILVGINHETAPVEIRERLAFCEPEIESALADIKRDGKIEEAVLFSTCNRTELLVRHSAMDEKLSASLPAALIGMLKSWKSADALSDSLFYCFRDIEAARHLFRVAAGLESMIVGEAQILSQVKESFRTACRVRTNGFITNKLLHSAFRAGKRARSETGIGIGAVSVSLAAVELSQKIFRDLSKKKALIIGAGQTARLTAEHFIQKNIGSISIANRTFQNAVVLAARIGGHAGRFDDLVSEISEADIIIGTTSSPSPIVTTAMVRQAMARRQNRALVLIDIAVPRDFEPDARKVYNVFANDIDALNNIVDRNLSHRRAQIPDVEKIIGEELAVFSDWHRSLEVTPTIKMLVDRIDGIRNDEIQRCRKYFSDDQLQQVDMLTQSIVKKILHTPISRMRESQNNEMEDSRYWVETVRNIFNLEQERDE